MSVSWTNIMLGEAGHWFSGGTPSKANASMWEGLVPWVSPKDMKRARIGDAVDHVAEVAIGSGTQAVPPHTLLMVVRGMILAHSFPVALTTRRVTFNQDIKALIPRSDISPEFLLYWLQSKTASVLKLTDVANHGTKRLPTELLFGMQLPVPPLPEQLKIAAILSSIDDTIETTQAVIHQLQVVKKAMMVELLTRGLPGRHTRFKQTEIGEMPEEWEVLSVADIGPGDRPTAQTGPFGAQLRPEDFVEAGVPVLKIGNVRWGFLRLNDLDFVRPEKAKELSRFRVRHGDLLFARQGATTGRNALADERCDGWLINYHLIRVATDHARCLPEFLMACFNSDLVQRQVGREKGRGNRDGINTANILSFRLPLPAMEEQRRITEMLARLDQARAANEMQREQLERTKSALMSVLLTGDLRVLPEASSP